MVVVVRTDTLGLSPARVPAQELILRLPRAVESSHSLRWWIGTWLLVGALLQGLLLLCPCAAQTSKDAQPAPRSVHGPRGIPQQAALAGWLALHPFVVQYDNRPPGGPHGRGKE